MAGANGHSSGGSATLEGGTIAALQGSLVAEEQTAVEALAEALSAIDGRNGELNALVTVCEERAREAAGAADARLQGGLARALEGVPFTVKDVIPVEGVRMTSGSRIFADYVARETAPAIARLEAAGAVVVGKTNTPEFALDPHTDNDLFGATLNPLDAGRTPGGSSGGDASAVAAGLVPFGIGSDYGGSIRWPAQCTGTVGFRPTPGLVSGSGHFPFIRDGRPTPPNSGSYLGRVATLAPLAATVADVWAVLAVLAGQGPGRPDPQIVPVPLGDPADVDPRSLGCAWTTGEGTIRPTDEVAAATRSAAELLSGLGIDVEERPPPALDECEAVYAAHRGADPLTLHRELVAGREELLTATMRTWFERVENATVADVQAIATESDRIRATVSQFMQERPILMIPVATGPAFELGAADFDARFRLVAPCRAISLLGLPSCAIPVGRTAEGLPLSAQIVGRPFHDHEVAAVAHLLEQALRG